jgi:hypothetical protein
MDADDRLRLDYEQTTGQISALTDVRFKLLGFIFTIATAAVAIVGAHPSTGALMGVGLLGLVATVGILLYELGNAQTLNAALYRAQHLQRALGLRGAQVKSIPAERTGPAAEQNRLFGAVPVSQDQAVGLVYGAALGGWGYLFVWGVLHGLHVSGARPIGGVIGALCAVAVMSEVPRVSSERTNEAAERLAPEAPPRDGTA